MKVRTNTNIAQVIGYLSITNTCCLEVLDIVNGIEDYVIFRFNGKIYRRMIYTNLPKGPYFRWANTRIYMHDIVRADWR